MGRKGFPYNALSQDEKLEQVLHPHWRVLVLPAFSTVVYLALTLTVWVVLAHGFWGTLLLGFVGIVGLVVWIVAALKPYLVWRSTQFAFTSRRVLVRRGVFGMDLSEIPLGRVNEVKVSKSMVDRFFGSGALIMGDYPALLNVPNVVAAFKLTNDLIEDRGHTKGVDAQRLEDRMNKGPAEPTVPDQRPAGSGTPPLPPADGIAPAPPGVTPAPPGVAPAPPGISTQ
jgi:membrane protein YdbS with pleckstrin-like domain